MRSKDFFKWLKLFSSPIQQAHYLRALALSALGKPEAAITAHCVALFLDKQSVSVASGIKQEIAKVLISIREILLK